MEFCTVDIIMHLGATQWILFGTNTVKGMYFIIISNSVISVMFQLLFQISNVNV
jgi:hypothetical protein